MAKKEVTQQEFEHLVSDAEYLQDEAEALKYVIDSVPYKETPPEGYSIYNMLKLIDHAQKEYFRPVVERVFTENRLIRLSDFIHFRESFEEVTDKEEMDVQKVLSRISKHRAALINVFKKINLIDWERELRGSNGERMRLIDFSNNMIREERQLLKEVADLVMIYQNERQHQREINRKAAGHKNS